jgi:hypothetical protein
MAVTELPEKIDLIVCARVGQGQINFIDDAFGLCCRCKVAIRFRPDVPKGPPKACIPCAVVIMEESKK